MAEKLSVQIALEGGAEIERQLANIGEAGQKAFADIEKSASQAGGFKNLKPEEVTDKLKTMGVEGTAAFDKIQKAVASAGNFEKLVVGIQSVETGFAALGRAAGPVVGGLIAAAGAIATAWLGVAKSINEVDAAAAKLGVSFQQFDKLRQGFLQAGISSEAVTSGLQKLKSQLDQMDVERVKKAFNELADAATRGFGAQGTAQLRLLEQAAKGVGPAADAARQALVELGLVPVGEQLGKVTEAFQRLGIKGSTLSEVIPQIIAKLQAMPDSVERTDLAISLLGDKLGVELVAALRTGTLSVDQFKAATGNLTREQQIAAAQTQQSINQMSAAWDNFKATVIAPIAIPLFDFMKSEMAAISQNIAILEQNWNRLKGALSTITPKTTIDISLTQSLAPEIDKINQKLVETQQKAASANQTLQQTGQVAAQTGQQAAQGLMPWGEFIAANTAKLEQLKQASVEAGGAAQQSAQQSAQAAQQTTSTWDTVIAKIGSFNDTLASIRWSDIQSAAVSAWNAITGAIQGAIDKLLQYIGLRPSAPAPGSGAPGKASGGLLGGRGSGTSDSNLAWVSRGEHIMPASVVRQPGVLSLLEALRRSGRIPGFADGGVAGGGDQLWNFLDGITTQLDNALRALNPALVNTVLQIAKQVEMPMQALLGLMSKISGKARGGLLGGRGSGTSDSNLAWVSRGEYITPARAVAQPGVLAFLEALRRSGGIPGFADGGKVGVIPSFADGGEVGGMMAANINALIASALAFAASMRDFSNQLQDELRAEQALFHALAAQMRGAASGGLLGGRGSGTSDSNLAWVSRGEYITPARAVAQPGVLAFLEALRRSGGNLSRVLDGMGRFALGGMIRGPIPAFAGGGLAGGMNNVTIQFPGLPAIGGLRASSDVVDQLHKAAALAQVRSGGRKPSRYS